MKIEETLLQLSNIALEKGEIPVAALIVFNNKIIAKAYNIRRNTNDILGHAEIICIRKAIKKQKDWRLNECELYVTMKPCKMCEEIIKESRIKKVNYLLNSNYTKINSNINIKKYNISKEYVDKLQQNMKNIFKNKR